MSAGFLERERILKYLSVGQELLYITREQCASLGLSRQVILDLTRQALLAHGTRQYQMPAKIGVHPMDDVFYHAMPAYVPSCEAVGVKWVECYPQNPVRYGLPQTTGLLILNDLATGCPMAVMDSTWLTAMRTPAVTVLAAAHLHPGASTFGMFGCGIQGIEHVRFACMTLNDLERIYVYDTQASAMDNLLETVGCEFDVEIMKATSPEQLVRSSQVLSSATVIAREPLACVPDAWVSAGQTILPCDLNTFWDPATSRRADLYIVDSLESHQLFESSGYFPDGLPRVHAETGQVLAGLKAGRTSPDQLIVCSNIGMAVCDVVVGRALLDLALEQGVGTRLPL